MNYNTKEGSVCSNIDVHVHSTCLIVHMAGKNSLYEFKNADTMIYDLRLLLTTQQLEHIKEMVEANCSKVKFKKEIKINNQLELF